MRRSPLQRRTPLVRRSVNNTPADDQLLKRPALKRNKRPPVTAEQARLALAFHDAGAQQPCCNGCGDPTDWFEVHHGCDQAVLKRELGRDVPWDVLMDPRLAVRLCSEPAENRCHERHTLRVRVLPRDRLPVGVEVFAVEHGLVWWLDRTYGLKEAG